MIRPAWPALLLVLASCGGTEAGTALSPGAVPIQVVDLAGIEQALLRQRGSACLLNFWATWCPPCVAELPDLLAVAREFQGRGAVLGVSYDLMVPEVERETMVATVREFLVERDLALPTLIYDAPDYDAINQRFDLPGGIPVTLAFDRQGQLVDRESGETSAERFREMMRKALAH